MLLMEFKNTPRYDVPIEVTLFNALNTSWKSSEVEHHGNYIDIFFWAKPQFYNKSSFYK